MPIVTTLSGAKLVVDLQTRDFEGFVADALELADTVAPEWTDRSELDVGVTLVEAMGFMADNLSYYQDRIGNEALFTSAVQRRSIIEHAALVGYRLRPSVSASVELTFVATGAGSIPANTRIEVDTSDGSDPASVELDETLVVGGAGTITGVIALHGTTVSETLGSSTGGPSQSFLLSRSPLTTEPGGGTGLSVYVAEGGPANLWTLVDNFLESTSTDFHYRVLIDEFDIVTVTFGDGVNGKRPASGTNNITATYRVGGGRTGNKIGPGALTKLVGSFPFISSVTNPAQPSGGKEKETIEEAKVNAPASHRALDRGINHVDYVALAKTVSGVSRASSKNGRGRYEEVITIAAAGSNPVPTGTWNSRTRVGTGLIGAIGTYLEARKTTPVVLSVQPVKVFDWYLDISVKLLANTRRDDAARLIEDTVLDTFDVEAQEFGQQVPTSQLSSVIEALQGIDYVDINRFQRQPYARLLTLASVTDLTFAIVVGSLATRDRWTVRALTSTTFQVSSSDSGVQPVIGTVGASYTPANGSFSFTAVAGATPPTPGDKWEIVTGPYVANLNPDSDELARLLLSNLTISLVGGVG